MLSASTIAPWYIIIRINNALWKLIKHPNISPWAYAQPKQNISFLIDVCMIELVHIYLSTNEKQSVSMTIPQNHLIFRAQNSTSINPESNLLILTTICDHKTTSIYYVWPPPYRKHSLRRRTIHLANDRLNHTRFCCHLFIFYVPMT